MSDMILYTSEDGWTRLSLRVEDETIWRTQLEIAGLFRTTKPNVSLHAQNIFEDGELRPEAAIKESLTVPTEGNRQVKRTIITDLLLAIGYRVRSPRGCQFRQWATQYFTEYLIKELVIEAEQLENLGGWAYVAESLARTWEIPASEKRFYQKVPDLFTPRSGGGIRQRKMPLFFAEV
jgi:hypothetical protein